MGLLPANEDEKLILQYKDRLEELKKPSNHTLNYTLGGLFLFVVGAIPLYFIGRSLDQIETEKKEGEKREIQREESAFRRAWLQETSVLERNRYEQIKNLILCRCIEVIEDLKALEKDGEYSKEKLEELKQLERAFCQFFPDELPMVVREINVSDFIKKFQN